MAWQSLPHQASCDSLPVPALHLHSPGWCHGRFSSWSLTYQEHSPSGIMLLCMRVCLRVYIHQHAWLKHQSADLWWMRPFIALVMTSSVRQRPCFEKKGTSNRQGRERTVINGTWIQSQSWIILIFFSIASFFTKIQTCPFVASLCLCIQLLVRIPLWILPELHIMKTWPLWERSSFPVSRNNL